MPVSLHKSPCCVSSGASFTSSGNQFISSHDNSRVLGQACQCFDVNTVSDAQCSLTSSFSHSDVSHECVQDAVGRTSKTINETDCQSHAIGSQYVQGDRNRRMHFVGGESESRKEAPKDTVKFTLGSLLKFAAWYKHSSPSFNLVSCCLPLAAMAAAFATSRRQAR